MSVDEKIQGVDSPSSNSIAIEDLVRTHSGWMLEVAERVVGDRSLAEDVVQDALINTLKGLDQFQYRSSIKTWLRRITINQAISKLRQLDRLSEESIDTLLPSFDDLDCRIEARWQELESPDVLLEREGVRNHINESLGKLPQSYSVIIVLRDIEGYTVTEVAKLIGISESNVKVRLHRARAALKKLLEPMMRDRGWKKT